MKELFGKNEQIEGNHTEGHKKRNNIINRLFFSLNITVNAICWLFWKKNMYRWKNIYFLRTHSKNNKVVPKNQKTIQNKTPLKLQNSADEKRVNGGKKPTYMKIQGYRNIHKKI